MFKFLRKYNKLLLAFFGVLLMITFLIPQAFENFSQQAGARRGTIATLGDDERVSALEWERYQRELRLLEHQYGSLALPGLGPVQGPEHWLLLVREAHNAGVVPVINTFDPGSEQMRSLMAATDERDPQIITSAQANLAGVVQLLNLYSTGDLYSDRRLRAEAERLLHSVNARMVVIKPDPSKSDLQPTEEQIAEHMQKYADQLPGEGEHGFGYKLPHRVKLEWLKIPVESIRAIVENSDAMDSVQQRLHWKRNPDGSLPPYPSDGSASAIPETVRTHLLNQLVQSKSAEISKFASDALALPLRGLPLREGYRVLPDDWAQQRKALPQLAEELRDRYTIALPEYAARADQWMAVDELATLADIGAATTNQLGSTPLSLTDLARSIRELDGSTTVTLQEGVAGPPLTDAEGNVYLYRITDADAARPPESVDEVRQQVIDDLKRMDDYQKRIKPSLASLEQAAENDGLLRVALEHDTTVHPPSGVYLANDQMLQIMMQYRMPLTSNPSWLPELEQDPDTVEKIIEHALTLPQDRPVAELSDEQRVFAVASDDKLAGVVLELVSQRPLTRETFNNLASIGAIQQLVALEEAEEQRSIEKAFSYETLAKRNSFELQRSEDEDPDAPEPTNTASAS